jgi:hypothetical protein
MNGNIALYLCSGALTIAATIAGIAPKVVNFNQSSQGHQSAMAAAETCQLVDQVVERSHPFYPPTGEGLPPGSFLCDALGNTSQVQPSGLLGPVSTGQPELIRKKLADRGFTFTPIPTNGETAK